MSVTRTRYQLKIFMFVFFLFLFKWKQNKDLFSGKQERSYMSCLVLLPNRAVGILLCCKHIYFQVLDRAEFHLSLLPLLSTPHPHLCQSCGFSWLSLTDLHTFILLSQPQCLTQNKLLLTCSDSILLLRA